MDKDPGAKMPKPFNPIPVDFLDIGGTLLAFMEERKIDGASLSRLSGVSESEVYNVLKNRRSRSGLKTLQKLLHPLGKTLADLFCDLASEKNGNLQKLEKDPAFVMEFKKQGVTIFSDTPPYPEFFIGRISVAGGAKGWGAEGLKEKCFIFLRVMRGNLEVEYGGNTQTLSIYQKLVLNAKYPHLIKNKSGTEPCEALMLAVPNLWTVNAA